MMDMSILIPARNEEWLAKTIEDILANAEAQTEVIAVLDGQWADPPVKDHPRVTLIHHSVPVGQRAATNEAARISKAKYIAKCDAHCAFDKGFDVKLMDKMQDDWTMVPIMKNLHVFDWVCENGHRRYQGPSGSCHEKQCGAPTKKEIIWNPKHSPNSICYAFSPEPKFEYFRGFDKRPEGKKEISETMSLQGSFWMMSREKYWQYNMCDEAFGSWGSQGIEVACKTWLSGGRVVCNKATYYGHCFRTQGGDFGFPYKMSGKQVAHAKAYARRMFFHGEWPHMVYPLSWLVKKFWPIVGPKKRILWSDQDLQNLLEMENEYVKKRSGLLHGQQVRRENTPCLPQANQGCI